MALKDSISKLDKALDRRLESLPDVSSRADREKYRGAVKTGVMSAGRRASVTLKNLDDMGDRAAGKLRPRKGGWDRLIDYSTANPFLTPALMANIANAGPYVTGAMSRYTATAGVRAERGAGINAARAAAAAARAEGIG